MHVCGCKINWNADNCPCEVSLVISVLCVNIRLESVSVIISSLDADPSKLTGNVKIIPELNHTVKLKVYCLINLLSIPCIMAKESCHCRGLVGHEVSRMLRLPAFSDSQYMKVAKFSATHIRPPLPPGAFLIFYPQGKQGYGSRSHPT